VFASRRASARLLASHNGYGTGNQQGAAAPALVAVNGRRKSVAAWTTLYAMEEQQRRICAAHSESTITVYQAYSPEIGLPAVRDGRFPAAWKRDRMTWVINQRSQTSTGGASPYGAPPFRASPL
jgi:Domain of unknown function (DUF4291)